MTDQATIQSTVREYVPGEKISVPGIYRNVPMEAYHGQICVSPSVSSSNIRKAEERNLEHAYEKWSGNPDYEPPDDTDHFGLGRLIHDLAAGDETVAERFIQRPSEWKDWRTGDAKKWRAQKRLDGMTVIDADDVEIAHGVMRKLQRHPTVQAGILHGLVEHSIFWIDPVTGLWCKARPDVIPTDSGMVVDLKTTTNASFGMCVNSITSFNYHIQMAMIDAGLRSLGFKMSEFVLLFVEKERPFSINHKPVAAWAMDYGHRQLERTLDRWAACLESGEWTGYDDDEVEAGLSEKVAKMLAKQAEEGTLPKRRHSDEEEAV